MKNKNTLIISILIPLLTGGLSALLSSNGMMIYNSTANKPPLTPPNIVFPIVWTILYILMGISSYIVYNEKNSFTPTALKWYGIQLFLNFCWPLIFFNLMMYLTAFIWIILMIVSILIMIYYFYKVKPVSAYLQIPYVLWCIFAAYLTLATYLLN